MPILPCKIYGSEFYIKPNHIRFGYGKYCSIKCRSQAQRRGKYILCKLCKRKVWKMPKELNHSKSGIFFCSKSCQAKWRNHLSLGSNHFMWKDGASIYRKIMIRSSIPKECKRCKINDVRILAVHHIDLNRKNNVIENLVWLCHNCHYLIHHDEDELNKLNRIIMVAMV